MIDARRWNEPSSTPSFASGPLTFSRLSHVANRCAPIFVFALALLLSACTSRAGTVPPPAPTVEVVSVLQQDTPIYSEWVAVLDGFVNAQIQPHVTGYIIRQNYKEGSVVKKGDVLFEIDPRPFRAALDLQSGSHELAIKAESD